MGNSTEIQPQLRTGWASLLARISMWALLSEVLTGLLITFGPFHAVVEWSVLLHTILGAALLIPLSWYLTAHWLDYRKQALSNVVLLGYAATVSLFVCALSGVVVTWQGLFTLRTVPAWRNIHLISTLVVLAGFLPHVILSFLRRLRVAAAGSALWFLVFVSGSAAAVLCLTTVLALIYSGTRYVNAFSRITVTCTAKTGHLHPVLHGLQPEVPSIRARYLAPTAVESPVATLRSSRSGVRVLTAMRRWTPYSKVFRV